MDGVSAAASLIAVIQLSAQVFSLCQEYYIGVKQARDDIKRLSNEVLAIHEILEKIADLPDGQDAAQFTTLTLLDKENGPAQQCAAQLEEVKRQLEPNEGMRKVGWRALKWPLKGDRVNSTVLALEKYKSAFTLALATDQAALSVKINRSIEKLKDDFANARVDEGMDRHRQGEERLRRDALAWLSTTDPSTNHAEQRRKHQPFTGRWLIYGEAMAQWCSTPNSLIWLHGTAGCGKTVLSSTIIDHVKDNHLTSSKSGLAYYYFDFNEPSKQIAVNFLSSIIAQLCFQCSALPDGVKELYQRCYDGNQRPTTQNLLAVLSRILGEFEVIFLIADAVDECPKSNNERGDLLKVFKELLGWSKSSLHVLITSRREPDIESALVPMLKSPAISIQSAQVDTDIKIYVESQLDILGRGKRWPPDLISEIDETLVHGANGMFRWAFCQLQALKSCLKPSLVRKKLKSLPRDLEETYARIITEIQEDYRQDALTALKWLTFSGRPLMLLELVEALLLAPRRQPAFNAEDRLSDPHDIMHILPGLVSISFNKTFNLEEIRLAHFSVKEYMTSESIGLGPAAYFGTTFLAAHQFILESCIAYILHYVSAVERMNTVEDLRSFPLLRYACRYWYLHMKDIIDEDHLFLDHHPSTLTLLMQLLRSEAAMRSWRLVHRPDMLGYKPFRRSIHADEGGSSLYYMACLGFQK